MRTQPAVDALQMVMQYVALATDYDGTVAHDGVIDAPTIAALERLRQSSRRLILVTGRELDDLIRVLPRIDLFDVVVAENGALLYWPAEKREQVLAEPPPPAFAQRLRAAGVDPLSIGRVIVATWEPNEGKVLDTIRDMGLELQIIFNKGAVMVLPAGVNKESGLRAALDALEMSPRNVVAVGDAENDFAFFNLCGMPVAVQNALPSLKAAAVWTTRNVRGAGVSELIDLLIETDLADLDQGNARQLVDLAAPLGNDSALRIVPQREAMLLAGASGGGKSTLTTGLLERMASIGCQYVVVDPEGDYDELKGAISVGTPNEAPRIEMVIELLRRTGTNVAINLLGIELNDRPAFFAELLPRVLALRARTGRPHMIVVDEAHHMLPEAGGASLPADLEGVLFVTVRPEALSHPVVCHSRRMLAVGSEAGAALRAFCDKRGLPVPGHVPDSVPAGELLTFSLDAPTVRHMAVLPGHSTLRRHMRKYAEGKLGEDRSFFFRGPDNRLKLRASNLVMFTDMSDGVDEATWEFHRRQGDYSTWLGDCVKDPDLADEVRKIEQSGQPTDEARRGVRTAIEARYTAPA